MDCGKETATKIVSKIMHEIRELQDYLQKGISIEAMLGIPTPYRCILGDVDPLCPLRKNTRKE